MVVSQAGTARLILDHVPASERTKFIRHLVQNLDTISNNNDANIVASLLQHHADHEARDRFLTHLRKGVEDGRVETVASLCVSNPALHQDLLSAAFDFVTAAATRFQHDSGKWVVVPMAGHSHATKRSDPSYGSEESFVTLIPKARYYLQLVQRLSLQSCESSAVSKLFHACLILLGVREKTLSHDARDTLVTLVDRFDLSEKDLTMLWDRIKTLLASTDPLYQSVGASVWLRWTCSKRATHQTLLGQNQYWQLIVQGLRDGDSERRKSFLQILRTSIHLALENPDCASMIIATSHTTLAREKVRLQYVRFCTVFETIVLGRYLNQVQECEPDLDFLSSSQSAVQPIWLYTLLAAALDNKMQDSNRKFIGAWIMRSSPRTDRFDDFIKFFRQSLLPWAMQGYLFTSSLHKKGSSLRCSHGDRLAQFVSHLIRGEPSITTGVIDSIVSNILGRHGNSFAYAMVYLMEGIGQGMEENKNLVLPTAQLERIEEMVGWVGLPEAARDHVLARFWKICYVQKSRDLNASDDVITRGVTLWGKILDKSASQSAKNSSDIDGSIASLRFEPSRREINEGKSKQKCYDLLQVLDRSGTDSINSSQFEERLDDIWSDLEYLEYPKGLLVNVGKTLLDRRIVQAAGRFAQDGKSSITLPDMVQKLRELAVSRSYLLPPLIDAIRCATFDPSFSHSIVDLEDFIVGLTEQPPTPTIDAQLEDATTTLIPSISPELQPFNYEFYFGPRESLGFAGLLDLVARLGRQQPEITHRILERVLARWKSQKTPPPTVSPWKKILQLQVMLICTEQYVPSADDHEAERILKDLHYILSIEPLPRYRYLLEWMVARVNIHHPELRHIIFEELNTKDHHSNPKFLASLMKIGVMLAKTEQSDEAFALQLANLFVPLAASSKVIIRHEAQWQVPILLEHGRSKQWSSIVGSTAFEALDEYIRSLDRFGDPPLERQIDRLDPIKDHNFTNLVEGRWYQLDEIEQRHCRHNDFLRLYTSDTERSLALPPSCMPLGDPISDSTANHDDTSTSIVIANRERTILQNIDNISRALGSGPGPTALQTKGAAYLESSHTRFSSLLVIASLVDNPYNLGGLSRVSEIFGAGALYLQHLNVISNKDFTNVSVSSHMHLDIHPLPAGDVAAFLSEKKRGEGFKVVGIEQTDRSVMIGEETCVLPEKCILVLGSEREGIPALLLSECDILVEIPQVGITRSLNVQTAAGIVLCEYARQRNAKKSTPPSAQVA